MASGGGSLNHTSKVPASRTAQNIVTRLGSHGAVNVMITFATDGDPAGISFTVNTPGHGQRAFALPVDVEAMYKFLDRQWRDGKIEPRFASRTQAVRTAWRVVEDWLAAQLALVSAGQAKLEQTMLPYMIVGELGATVYDRYRESGLKELES